MSPLTAGGIHPALESGRRAGIALSDYLLDAAPRPERAIGQPIRHTHLKRLLRAGLETGAADLLVEYGLRSSPFQWLAQQVFFHHRKLMPLEAWQQWKRTRAAVRSG